MQLTGDAGARDQQDEQRDDNEHKEEEADLLGGFPAAERADSRELLYTGIERVAG